MNTFETAIRLAKKHFHVFPILANTKDQPLIKGFPQHATTDPEQIKSWWMDQKGAPRPHNIGISTTHFNGSEALLVVDVDCKNGKDGEGSMLELELGGHLFPVTLTQVTPTGGRHLIYRTKVPVKQGVSVLGSGLDIRSKGGYIVGAGSTLDGKAYSFSNDLPVAEAPEWLVQRCGLPREKVAPDLGTLERVDYERARERAIFYLEFEAPLAVKGDGGDQTTYKVAAQLKDFGVDPSSALELMLDHWNDRCPPGWSPERLQEKIDNAYRYGSSPVAVRAPEAFFEPIETQTPTPDEAPTVEPEKLHPFQELNKNYAFVMAGSGHHILWETVDGKGRPALRHLKEESFHKDHAAWKLNYDGKQKPVTKLWIESKERRSYKGFCFRPQQPIPPGWYNLFRGWALEPKKEASLKGKKALADWLGHIRDNVCHGHEDHYRWVVGYFAHLFQRPWEKPLVAVALRGLKGTGKNAVFDRIGDLLGGHYMETAQERHVFSHFNAHLENKLAITLSEAFWSGAKQAEATLKHLVTGETHIIEHKGQETFEVPNLTRVLITGNDDWVVPASHDERRYAVFDVGTGRLQDKPFFRAMERGMREHGGNALLLQFLLDYDLTGIDVGSAPDTEGLREQKRQSLGPFERWWFDCLTSGEIVGGDFTGSWPEEKIDTRRFRDALRRYLDENKVKSWMPTDKGLGKKLHKFLPSIRRKQVTVGDVRPWFYFLPSLEAARAEWEKYIGHREKWDSEEGEC